MPKVTIIMPSLNVVRYIKPCMESVLSQTLEDIEILSVDAGSIDGTAEIIQDYAQKDRRIKYISSNKKSYGYQINLGISLARGEYVGIVETDDIIVPDMYEVLYNTAVKDDAEYVKGRVSKFVEIKNNIKWIAPMALPVVDKEEMGKVIETQNRPEILVKDIYLWTGIYKKEFIKKIVLNESPGAAFQDQGFLFQTISRAKRAIYLDKLVYYYRQDNANSSIFNRKGFRYLVGEYDYVARFLNEKNVSWKKSYYQRMLNQCIGRFESMALSGEYWEEAEAEIEILRNQLCCAVENKIIQNIDLTEDRWNLLQLFLQGSKNIYSYCMEIHLKRINKVNRLLTQIKDKEIIIFGCGNYGKFFHALLEIKNVGRVVAYCDNNSKLWNTKIQDKVVLSLDETLKQFPRAMYVVANLRNADVIKNQLKEIGIIDKRVYVYQESTSILLFLEN